MRILLGGIPLGCDNIGDEAIIAGVVKMLKSSMPDAELTVATADPATADRLDVKVVPSYGFAGVGLEDFAAVAKMHDAYVWCGATGLSDYPAVALDLLDVAQKAGVATFVWGVGMDDELNPVFFRASGRRRALLRLFGLVGWYERRLRAKLARRISNILPHCKGVWLRDPQSVTMLAKTGFSGAQVAADSAILLQMKNEEWRMKNTDDAHSPFSILHSQLGLCISTQRQVKDVAGLVRLIAAVRESGAQVLGIPMNPKTDRVLLESLGVECIPGTTPEAVMEAAAGCDLVLSSRLHLLILAANVGTPGLGIARGSKLANWLANFNRQVEGSVSACDWEQVTAHVLAALKERGDWDAVRAAAYARLTARLESARAAFVEKLEACHAG